MVHFIVAYLMVSSLVKSFAKQFGAPGKGKGCSRKWGWDF